MRSTRNTFSSILFSCICIWMSSCCCCLYATRIVMILSSLFFSEWSFLRLKNIFGWAIPAKFCWSHPKYISMGMCVTAIAARLHVTINCCLIIYWFRRLYFWTSYHFPSPLYLNGNLKIHFPFITARFIILFVILSINIYHNFNIHSTNHSHRALCPCFSIYLKAWLTFSFI